MTCEQFTSLLSQWLDSELSPAQAEEMLRHADGCADCRQLSETLQSILSSALPMGNEEPPAQATRAWREAVRNDKPPAKEKNRSGLWLRLGAVAASFLLLVGLTALGRQQPNAKTSILQPQNDALSLASAGNGVLARQESATTDEPPELDMLSMEPEAMPESAVLFATDDTLAQQAPPQGTMLRHSARVSLRTMQFDIDSEKLLMLPNQLEGWIERQSLSGQPYEKSVDGRLLSLTLRVPAEKLEEALLYLDSIGTLETKETYAEDISEQYYDVQGRLENARLLRTQLQALVEKTEDVEVLASLTRELNDNQLTIDSLEGTLRGLDSRVAYSEVSISLSEQQPGGIAPETGITLAGRIKEGFVNSINAALSFLADMVVTLVWLLPWIIPIGLAAWLITWWFRKRHKG